MLSLYPPDKPDAPGQPSISNITASSMTLNWSVPSSDGGSPVTGYLIEKKDRFSSRWSRVNDYSTQDVEFIVSGLKQGSEYEFRVAAENKAGVGKPSESSGYKVAKPPYGESIVHTSLCNYQMFLNGFYLSESVIHHM